MEKRIRTAYVELMQVIRKRNKRYGDNIVITNEELIEAGLVDQLKASILKNENEKVGYLQLYSHRGYRVDNLYAGTKSEKQKALIESPTKACPVCNKTLPKTAFRSESGRYDGLEPRCGDCRNIPTKRNNPDLVGMKIGKLTVLSSEGSSYNTQCECGTFKTFEKGRVNKGYRNPNSTLGCGLCGQARLGEDLVGKHINNFQVTDFKYNKTGANEVLVKCDCDTSEPFWVEQGKIRNDKRLACHGLKCTLSRNHSRSTGGKSKPGEGKSEKLRGLLKRYHSMHGRCYDERDSSYPNYGAKGITVDEVWHKHNPLGYQNFEKWFLEQEKVAMEKGVVNPSIDRKDNTEGYNPENCRLVSKSVQSANRNHVIRHTYNHIRPTVSKVTGKVTVNKISLGFEYHVYEAYLTIAKIPEFLDLESLLLLHYIRATHKLIENKINEIPFEIHIATIEETKQHAKYHIRKERTSTPDSKRHDVLFKHRLEDGYPSIGHRSIKLVINGTTKLISTIAYSTEDISTIKFYNALKEVGV
ncbi:MAG: hypothetical protein U9Q83_05085 [Bacteroidota bacterium]|nr:hypothetical protein [Bacteroidota bacterium]